jgi:hypothetical protein
MEEKERRADDQVLIVLPENISIVRREISVIGRSDGQCDVFLNKIVSTRHLVHSL